MLFTPTKKNVILQPKLPSLPSPLLLFPCNEQKLLHYNFSPPAAAYKVLQACTNLHNRTSRFLQLPSAAATASPEAAAIQLSTLTQRGESAGIIKDKLSATTATTAAAAAATTGLLCQLGIVRGNNNNNAIE